MPDPRIVFNRRHTRVQQLLGHVLHAIGPLVADQAFKEIAVTLEDLFYATGTYILTDADRAAAGLPLRDHNGMTLEELRIIEAKMIEGMSRPPPPMLIKCPKCNYQAEFTIGSHVAPVGDANEPRSSARDPLTIKPKNKSDWMR